MKRERSESRTTVTPVVAFSASSKRVMPCPSIWVLVMTLTDCGVSLGDKAKPVVVRMAEVVNESRFSVRVLRFTACT